MVFSIFFLIVITWQRYHNRQFKEQLTSFAKQLDVELSLPSSRFNKLIGIEYKRLSPQYQVLHGQYRNHPIVLTFHRKVGGQYVSETIQLRVQIAKPNIDTMSISPREISTKIRAKLSKLSRIFSTQDIRVNPEYLDVDRQLKWDR